MTPVLQVRKQLLRSEMICRRSQPEVVELGCESLALFGLRVNLLSTDNWGIGLFVPRSEYGVFVRSFRPRGSSRGLNARRLVLGVMYS